LAKRGRFPRTCLIASQHIALSTAANIEQRRTTAKILTPVAPTVQDSKNNHLENMAKFFEVVLHL
jgi:hypothetical protein